MTAADRKFTASTENPPLKLLYLWLRLEPELELLLSALASLIKDHNGYVVWRQVAEALRSLSSRSCSKLIRYKLVYTWKV